LAVRQLEANARLATDITGCQSRWREETEKGTMVVIGTLTGVGMWILGVPLALLLGVLAALLNFIPTFGPLLAFIPAALLSLTQGPSTFLYVCGLWLVAQNLEGHVLTPLIQRRTVELPPILTIVAQVIFATLFGVIGVVVAAPLTAVILVIVKMLYVQDVLGNPVRVPRPRETTQADPANSG
jgi:predicted PurR-regulated permease PerM